MLELNFNGLYEQTDKRKFKLVSGATFDVTLLAWEQSFDVFQELVKEMEKIDGKGLVLEKITESDLDFFQRAICQILGSQKLLDVARRCLKVCIYNGMKIDPKVTFELENARGDFLVCCFLAIKENISPFLSNLISYLKEKFLVALAQTPIEKEMIQ